MTTDRVLKQYVVVRPFGPLRAGDLVTFHRPGSSLGIVVRWRFGTTWVPLDHLQIQPTEGTP